MKFAIVLTCLSSFDLAVQGFTTYYSSQSAIPRRRRRRRDTVTQYPLPSFQTAQWQGTTQRTKRLQLSVVNKDDSVVDLLKLAGYGKRMVKLGRLHKDKPHIVEVFVNGQAVLARLVDIVASSSSLSSKYSRQLSPPRVVVELLSPDPSNDDNNHVRQTIDLGQVTTIWSASDSQQVNGKVYAKALKNFEQYQTRNAIALDKTLDKVYARFVRQGRKTNDNTKSQRNSLSKDERTLAMAKTLRKVGPGYTRIVDSAMLSDVLPNNNKENIHILSQCVASLLLAKDAKEGGRFKRWPSLLVSRKNGSNDDDEWTLINGGWLVVDQNVRAGNEARKLVERFTSTRQKKATATDERIIQRLECLAMGDTWQENGVEEFRLEKDVRETLRTMELPLDPRGARDALIRLGQWSCATQSKMKQVIQPWSPDILEAATWYASLPRQQWLDDETRSDLTKVPAVCVDAKSTSFRDDAMSVRPRASTRRWVDEEASKWEILIHITDMSDIYVPSRTTLHDPRRHLITLQQAAASRGVSRYDLPLGPLHLLPPIVLQALSFSKDTPQRCVTLWLYIDERDGKLLDAGFERSLVAPPTQVSYSEATKLMNVEESDLPKNLARARTILLVVERCLKLWKDRRIRASQAAQKREGRLSSRVTNVPDIPFGDAEDGRTGFQRTRGHRLVDACLDLYSFVGQRMLRQRKAPLPMASGADVSRGGRLGTAPLRRYIDGQGQRQLLAALCQHGDAMTLEECRQAGRLSNNARNAISNVRAGRQTTE